MNRKEPVIKRQHQDKIYMFMHRSNEREVKRMLEREAKDRVQNVPFSSKRLFFWKQKEMVVTTSSLSPHSVLLLPSVSLPSAILLSSCTIQREDQKAPSSVQVVVQRESS